MWKSRDMTFFLLLTKYGTYDNDDFDCLVGAVAG